MRCCGTRVAPAEMRGVEAWMWLCTLSLDVHTMTLQLHGWYFYFTHHLTWIHHGYSRSSVPTVMTENTHFKFFHWSPWTTILRCVHLVQSDGSPSSSGLCLFKYFFFLSLFHVSLLSQSPCHYCCLYTICTWQTNILSLESLSCSKAARLWDDTWHKQEKKKMSACTFCLVSLSSKCVLLNQNITSHRGCETLLTWRHNMSLWNTVWRDSYFSTEYLLIIIYCMKRAFF